MYKIPCKKKCKGTGEIESYKHVEDGICFECYGSKFQEVDKQQFDEYNMQLLRVYILFNKGNFEYYQNEQEIQNKYGNFFFCGEYGDHSALINYKDKNIVYKLSNSNNELFEKNTQIEWNKRKKESVIEEIMLCKEVLKIINEEQIKNQLFLKINRLEEFKRNL
jgi:hypothetical protein